MNTGNKHKNNTDNEMPCKWLMKSRKALCDTFCVLRSVEASRLALALCEFVLHTFQDEGGLKNIDFEDINGKEYTLAFGWHQKH